MTVAVPTSTAGQGSALVNAAGWIEQLVFGSLATAIAVLGVALVGFMMLQGRVEWRRGMTVCAGCFLVFGARSVAASFLGAAQALPSSDEQAPVPVTPAPVPSPPAPIAYDPYAGASLPQ